METLANITVEPSQTPADILDKAMCLSLELGRLGVKRKISTSSINLDEGVNEDLIHVSKDILDADSLKAITKLDGEIRTYINRKCLPSLFRSGIYLLPVDFLEQVYQRLEEFKEKREMLVATFVNEYEKLVEEAQTKLGKYFDPMNYPSLAKVRASFSMDVRLLSFSTPTKLQKINPAIFQREMEKAKESIAMATEELRTMWKASFQDLLNHMLDRLSVGENGKQKIFHASSLDKINDFLESFQTKNIVNDTELQELVGQAKQIMEGVSPEVLRKNDQVRDKVKEDFNQIKSKLDQFLVAKPKRVIKFEGEEEVSNTEEINTTTEEAAA